MHRAVIALIFSLFLTFVVSGQSKNTANEILSPTLQDAAEAEQKGFQIFKLLPRGMFEFEKNELSIRGGGAFYSFVKTSHSYNETPQIGLEQNYLSVGFYGASYGLIADLGSVSLEGVGKESEEVKFLAEYKPPTIESEVRIEQKKAHEYDTEKATYRSRVPVSTGHSYALRAISFDEADVLVAFRIYRKNADGSLVIFWKLIEKFETPKLIRDARTGSVQKNPAESAAVTSEIAQKVENALRLEGFNNVTVDYSTIPATLRGSVPKGKLAEAVQTAQEAAGKPFVIQIKEQ